MLKYFLLNCVYRLQDLAGYGVALAVGKEFASAFPDRTFKSPLVELLVKNGRNGMSMLCSYLSFRLLLQASYGTSFFK